MKTIDLTRGQVAIVDDEDYERLNKHKWHANKKRSTFYAVRKTEGKMVYMHRIIAEAKDGEVVDHINRNELDNTKENLRVVTRSQNGANRKSYDGTSKYLGVHLVTASGKWIAKIKKDGIKTHIGVFKTEIEAAKAYDKAAIEIHKEFANLNFK